MGSELTKLLLTAIACVILPACATNVGGTVDSVPTWLGGMPGTYRRCQERQNTTSGKRSAPNLRLSSQNRRTLGCRQTSFNGRNPSLA